MNKKRRIATLMIILLLVLLPAFAAADRTAADVIAVCESQLEANGYIPAGIPCQAQATAYESVTRGVRVTKWYVVFTADQPEGPHFVYYLYMDPPGTIITSGCGDDPQEDASIIVKRLEWERAYGLYNFWTAEEKARFNEQVTRPLGSSSGYGLPDEGEIREAEAVRIARGALAAAFGLSQPMLDTLWQGALFQTFETMPSYWIVNYWEYDPENDYLFRNAYAALIDAGTGNVLDLISY